MPFLDSDVEIAELQVALDAIFLHALADNLVSGPAQVFENDICVSAKVFRDDFLTGYAADHLATVATGCAPSDFVCLNDMHIVTALGEV